MYPNNAQYLQEVYKDATAPSFGYLFIDLKQETQKNLTLRANVHKAKQHIHVPSDKHAAKTASNDMKGTNR